LREERREVIVLMEDADDDDMVGVEECSVSEWVVC